MATALLFIVLSAITGGYFCRIFKKDREYRKFNNDRFQELINKKHHE